MTEWRFPIEPNNEGDVFEAHQTEEGFQRALRARPKLRQCTHASPMDPSIPDAEWYHMDGCEVFDDGEHYLQYKCLNCGTLYDIWIPDC